MGIKVITPAAALFTIAELRLHLDVDVLEGESTHPKDARILSIADDAKRYAEHYCNRVIGSQTLELALDEFPAGSIALPRGPVTSIASITYVDTAGDTQTLSSSLYALDDYSTPCWAVPAVDTYWPATLATANAVKVRYVAGDFPASVRSGILLLIWFLYENKGLDGSPVPDAVHSLLDAECLYGFA